MRAALNGSYVGGYMAGVALGFVLMAAVIGGGWLVAEGARRLFGRRARS